MSREVKNGRDKEIKQSDLTYACLHCRKRIRLYNRSSSVSSVAPSLLRLSGEHYPSIVLKRSMSIVVS
jgi:hypothetical protein